jgi:hypothetical protein
MVTSTDVDVGAVSSMEEAEVSKIVLYLCIFNFSKHK